MLHPEAQHLQNSDVVVDVYRQAGKPVGLTVHKAIGASLSRHDPPAQGQAFPQPAHEELCINSFIAPAEQPHCYLT